MRIRKSIAYLIVTTLLMSNINVNNVFNINSFATNIANYELNEETKAVYGIKEVINNTSSTFILKENGTLWACGNNEYGHLGLEESEFSSPSTNDTMFQKVNIDNVKKVVSNGKSTFVIKNDDTLWACGYNGTGELGLSKSATNSDTKDRDTFEKVDITNVKDVVLGDGVTYVITKSGDLYVSGANTAYQLISVSNSSLSIRYKFVQTTVSNVSKVITNDNNSTFILKNDGTVSVCGDNTYGQLSTGSTGNTKLTDLNISDVKDIVFKDYTVFLLKTDNTLWGCGQNSSGQLGLGDKNDRKLFEKISEDIEIVSTNGNTTFIIKTDGTLWATGINTYGQLGLSSTASQTSFVYTNVDNVDKVTIGYQHTVILKTDGTVWSTGRNLYGQLGLNSSSTTSTYFKEVSVDNTKEIQANNNSTFLLKTDGTLWTCGYNSGQLGLGSLTKADTENKKEFYQVSPDFMNATESVLNAESTLKTEDIEIAREYVNKLVLSQERTSFNDRLDKLQNTQLFSYTGEVQEFIAPYDGEYLLEVWGAEGGDNDVYHNTYSNNGAYAKGTYSLNKGESLYIYIGKQGQEIDNITTGGGSTDIRTELQNTDLEFITGSDEDKRILVAGGGAGLPYQLDDMLLNDNDRVLQGIIGGNTISYSNIDGTTKFKSQLTNTVTTQTNKGETGNIYGSGGDGYYGGKSNTIDKTEEEVYTQGVGGTSYTGKVGEGLELSGNMEMPSPKGGTQMGNEGDGYAKITLVNQAPDLVLSPTLYDGIEVSVNQPINISGTIRDDVGNYMSVYYKIDDSDENLLIRKKRNSNPVAFDETFLLPDNLSLGVHTLTIWTEDDLGAISEIITFRLNLKEVDNEPPTLTLDLLDVDEKEKVIIAIAKDEGSSGLKSITTPEGKKHYEKEVVRYSISQNGTYTFVAEDNCNNKTVQTIEVTSFKNNNNGSGDNNGNIEDSDTKYPVGELELIATTDKWTNKDVIITAVMVNTNNAIKYITLPNGNTVNSYKATYAVNQNGIYIFEAVDEEDNLYRNAIVINNIDKNNPTVEIINNQEWTDKNVDVTINATDI